MNNGLYMSINPNTISKIEKKVKTYEFRNYVLKREFDKLYVCVAGPVCELKIHDQILEIP